MHVSLIVKCCPSVNKGSDKAQIRNALDAADYIMSEGYSGLVDYWTAGEDDWTKEAIVRKDGKKVAACRAKDFQCFTDDGDPYYFLSGNWYDYGVLKDRGWDEIIERELAKAMREDNDRFPIWLACLNVHV